MQIVSLPMSQNHLSVKVFVLLRWSVVGILLYNPLLLSSLLRKNENVKTLLQNSKLRKAGVFKVSKWKVKNVHVKTSPGLTKIIRYCAKVLSRPHFCIFPFQKD